jgi:N-acyl-phosphatidylethanolamine-hydrolysing phospholipase D
MAQTPAPHHDPKGGFRNPWPNGTPSGFLAVLKWSAARAAALRTASGRVARRARPTFPTAAPAIDHPRASPDRVTVTWVGHSTVLVQVGGINVLTDPMWSERASPTRFAGPKRWVAPGVDFAALPPIDLVLISHNHYDHLDAATVRRVAARHPEAAWAAPLGVAAWLRSRGAREVAELDWWGAARLGAATVAATPAQHFSGRGVRDRMRTLWCGWAVAVGERRILFCGDTGYHPEGRTVGARFGPFDVALVPVGAYDPRWFMRPVHMNPEEGVQLFRDVRAGAAARRSVMVPIHWGTFRLTDEPMDEPPRRTREAWLRAGLPADDLWLLRHGETRAM